MSVTMNFVIGLASAGGVYFWAKTQLFKPDLPNDRDIFSSRGVPLVNRAARAAANGSERSTVISTGRATSDATMPTEHVDEKPSPSEQAGSETRDGMSGCSPSGKVPVPEDSVLKRHYLAQKAAERRAITHPYPSDSVLRRHHESRLAFSLTQHLETLQPPDVVEPVLAVGACEPARNTGIAIPEDSVLKRHFLAHLQTEIERTLPVRPTEATLKRHHAQLVQSKLAALLS